MNLAMLVSLLNRRKPSCSSLSCRLGVALQLCVLTAVVQASYAQNSTTTLPDGPGKQTTIAVCGKCHSPDRAAALHQTRRAWQSTIAQMVSMGANASDDQLDTILDYLSKNFPPLPPTPVNINTADPVELESSLLLLKSEARAVIQYRTEHGPFKSLDDLRKVPGLDFKKIEDSKVRIVF